MSAATTALRRSVVVARGELPVLRVGIHGGDDALVLVLQRMLDYGDGPRSVQVAQVGPRPKRRSFDLVIIFVESEGDLQALHGLAYSQPNAALTVAIPEDRPEWALQALHHGAHEWADRDEVVSYTGLHRLLAHASLRHRFAEERRRDMMETHVDKGYEPDDPSSGTASADAGAADEEGTSLAPSTRQAFDLQSVSGTWSTRYRIDELIGRGAQGAVCSARHLHLNREVALKVADQSDGRHGKRFRHEAMITAALEHPNIIPIYDAGPDHLVTKRIRGTTLAAHVREGDVALEESIEALVSVCNAVAFAHDREIIHRDLKADNVIIGPFGEVLVLDWGLAVQLVGGRLPDYLFTDRKEEGRSKGPSPFAGTPLFMAPEVAGCRFHEVGTAVDVFGLGGMLHQILSGRAPFEDDTIQAVIARARGNRRRPIQQIAPGAPKLLRELVESAMDSDPAARPTALEFQERLRNWLHQEDRQDRAVGHLALARRLVGRLRDEPGLSLDQACILMVHAIRSFDKVVTLDPEAQEAVAERQHVLAAFQDLASKVKHLRLGRVLTTGIRRRSASSVHQVYSQAPEAGEG